MNIKRIQQALYNADFILEEEEQDVPPGVNPGSLESHGYSFPGWLLPPEGDESSWGKHAMWPLYQLFMEMLNGPSPHWMPNWAENVLSFGDFLSLLRAMLRPHIPNTIFTRISGLRRLMAQLGIKDEFLQNYLRDMLRQWMLENLDMHYDLLVLLFPHLFAPHLDPESWTGYKPGGLPFRPESEGLPELPDDTGLGPYSPGIDYWQDAIHDTVKPFAPHNDDGTDPWAWTRQLHGKI